MHLFKRRSFQVLLGLLGLTVILFTLLAATPFTPGFESKQGGLDPRIQKIMNEAVYKYGEWSLLETNPATGQTVQSLAPAQRLFVQGSTTKIFSVSAALDDLGFTHHFTTPVYSLGQTSGGSLNGTLV